MLQDLYVTSVAWFGGTLTGAVQYFSSCSFMEWFLIIGFPAGSQEYSILNIDIEKS